MTMDYSIFGGVPQDIAYGPITIKKQFEWDDDLYHLVTQYQLVGVVQNYEYGHGHNTCETRFLRLELHVYTNAYQVIYDEPYEGAGPPIHYGTATVRIIDLGGSHPSKGYASDCNDVRKDGEANKFAASVAQENYQRGVDAVLADTEEARTYDAIRAKERPTITHRPIADRPR